MVGNLTPKKVLIIEDDKSLQKALTEKFTLGGFTVISAYDGKEGAEKAREYHPNLITLDVLMPVVDGFTCMDEIRKDEWGKSVPIIVLTNNDTNDHALNKIADDHPAYYFIKSSVTLDEIITKAHELTNELSTPLE